MNVPETMNEVLDMSDDEGMECPLHAYSLLVIVFFCLFPGEKFTRKIFLKLLGCFVIIMSRVWILHTYNVRLNHAVRKANAPEMLSDGEYISDIEEGTATFLF